MYRVAICEDEPALRQELHRQCAQILQRLDTEHRLTDFPSAEALEKALDTGAQFDLLCLDILMPGMNGMQLAQSIRQRDEQTSILFITSTEEFLLEGYSVRPIQYLLKPVQPEQLENALRTDLRLHHQPHTVTIHSGGKTAVLPLEDILYVESRNHGCVFCTAQQEHFFWMTLAEAEQLLPGEHCRCHKSFLVNLQHIRQVNGRIILLPGGKRLDIGPRYAEPFQRLFARYLNAGR